MKKVIKTISIFFILIITIVLIKFAWAKYMSTINGNGNMQIAQWKFEVKANNQPISSNIIDFSTTRTDKNVSVAPQTLAPGTFGEFDLIIDTTGTEVLMVYDININLINCPTNLKFYVDENMQHEIAKKRINDNSSNETIYDELNISKFLALDNSKPNYVGIAHTEKIYWEWPFETGKNQAEKDANNVEDSKWLDIEKMTMKIEAIGNQVLQEPNKIIISNLSVNNANGSTSTATINTNINEYDLIDSVNAKISLENINSTTIFNISLINLSDDTYYLYNFTNLELEDESNFNDSDITCEFLDFTAVNGDASKIKLVSGTSVNFRVIFKFKDELMSINNHTLKGQLRFLILNDDIISQKLSNLDYQRVEYIANTTGSQYIDTEIVPDEHYGFYADIYIEDEIDKYNPILILGSSIINNGYWGGLMIGTHADTNGGQMTYFPNNKHYNKHFLDPALIAYHRMQIELMNDTYRTSDGYTLNLTKESFSKICGSLYIFTVHCENGAYYQNSNGRLKLFEFKTYYDSTIIQYLVPCYRKSDNKIGLYDVIEDKFYSNQGSGSFSKGNDI